MKQNLTLFAVLVMALAMPQNGFAYDFSAVAPSGQTLYYNINGTNVTVTYPGSASYSAWPSSFTKPAGTLVIPSSVTYSGTTYTVTSIGSSAFRACSNLTSVTLPNTITNIGSGSFQQCTNLPSITIPNAVTSIGSQAFYNCANLTTVNFNADSCINTSYGIFSGSTHLTSVTIGNTVKVIPNSLFSNCSGLTHITIPTSVVRINSEAFYLCTGLSTVQIPNTVTYIGTNAFYRVRNIAYYGTASGSPWGANTINGFVDGNFVYTDASKTILTGYYGTDTAITIPNTVSTIGDYAFWNCANLVSIVMSNNVISIGNYAFYGCRNLSSMTLSSSLGTIGNYAFCRCFSLSTINIPNSVYSLGEYAFSMCSGLETAYLGSSLSSISQDAFSDCWNLRFVSFPPYLSSIGYSAFRNCYHLASLTVPSSVTQIGMQAFEFVRNIIYNGPAEGDCYGDLCYWGARCLNGYLEDSVYYLNSTKHDLMSIHPDAKTIVVSDSTRQINNYAFYHTDVQRITISSSVTSIGNQVFDSCFLLRDIVCERQNPPIWQGPMFYDPYALDNIYDSIVLHVPCGALLGYAHSWHCFDSIVEPVASYSVSVVSADTNMGIVTPLLSPSCSSNQWVVLAQPNNGYFFSSWDDGNTTNPRYLIVNSDTSITAYFSINPPAPDTIQIHDTTIVVDTLVTFDTLYVTDTVNTRDTIYLPVYLHDTIFVHDTVIVYDTVYITGVENAEPLNAKIYARDGQIMVEGANGYTITLYDAVGRLLATKETLPSGEPCELGVAATGVYLVKVGPYPARRIVVKR